MSRESVELVREVYRGWARGDFKAGADVFSSDFEWQQLRIAVEPGSHRGADIGVAVRRVFEVYEDFRVEADEYIDAGDEVVVVARSRGTARASAMQLDQRFAYV
jgi:ketosteroid isomerase-like protein